jgi:hypothetical protein
MKPLFAPNPVTDPIGFADAAAASPSPTSTKKIPSIFDFANKAG